MKILQNNDMDCTYKLLLYYSTLAYLGIDVIDFGEAETDWDLFNNNTYDEAFTSLFGKRRYSWYKFTVPEKSELVLNDQIVKEIIKDRPFKTGDDLIEIAKYIFREKISKLAFTEKELKDIENSPLWNNFVKNDVKLYAKIRTNETWSNESSIKKVKEFTSGINEAILDRGVQI